ncbi:Hypothetical protein SRAE_X000112000 [Strongyloides ratti]|uniref:Uncharacterized protein n=1 Tax=Strongyloides ratti TaxID=34506 RepID=A0A090MMW2_STRRB|nr:Hypothetical protein SRAE_X000112000 [Strongyloides ratti]CEF59371.1 Hypothetical protein SRAE_X000112000 [Strongyloides ratti]
MDFLTLSDELVDEKAAVKFFQSHGIIPEEKECSNRHQMKMHFRKYFRWKCYIKECREECGIRIGTWFQDTRLPFRTAALFIYNWGEERTSVDFYKKELKMAHCTTVDWNNYLRELTNASGGAEKKGDSRNPYNFRYVEGVFPSRRFWVSAFASEPQISFCGSTYKCLYSEHQTGLEIGERKKPTPQRNPP